MRMRCAGHVARMVEMRNVYKILVGKRERKISHGRPRHNGRIKLKWILKK
jgi:hypothetical protein